MDRPGRRGEEGGDPGVERAEPSSDLEARSLPWSNLFLRLALGGGELLWKSRLRLGLRRPRPGEEREPGEENPFERGNR